MSKDSEQKRQYRKQKRQENEEVSKDSEQKRQYRKQKRQDMNGCTVFRK